MRIHLGYFLFLVAGSIILRSALGQEERSKVDPDLPSYIKADVVPGSISSVGSDTLDLVMRHWTAGFSSFYPGVRIHVEGKGSNTAPVALLNATAELGPMSREMKRKEIDGFSEKFGYPPTQLRVALDALAIFVHKDNPLSELTLEQADAIFSKGRKRGYKEDVTTWGQLGLGGAWSGRKINLYSRNTLSGTYIYFKDHVLREGEFKETIMEQPGSAAVVEEVARDPYGIGYSGLGYVNGAVKALKIAERQGMEAMGADAQNVYDGSYPIYRFLYVYVNRDPAKPLRLAVREFCRFMLSKDGQGEVMRDGFIPLPAVVAKEEAKKLD